MQWEDFVSVWTTLDKTRLFTGDWKCVNCLSEFTEKPNENERFMLLLEQEGKAKVEIVLSHEDTRPFKGKEDYDCAVSMYLVRVDSVEEGVQPLFGFQCNLFYGKMTT